MDSEVWQIFEIKSDFYWKILIEPLNQIKIEKFSSQQFGWTGGAWVSDNVAWNVISCMETVNLLWLGCEMYLEFLAWRTLLHFRYYGNSMERQPTITVTEYEDNKAESIRNIGYSLQRSTTDSIISYTANGNFYPSPSWKPENPEIFETGQKLWDRHFLSRRRETSTWPLCSRWQKFSNVNANLFNQQVVIYNGK